MKILNTLVALGLTLWPAVVLATSGPRENTLDPTQDPRALVCLLLFILAYFFVIGEEAIHMRKSKTLVLAGCIIWVIIGMAAPHYGVTHEDLRNAVLHDVDDYGALALFLLVAMTYINAISQRGVFESMRVWLVDKGLSYRQLFWISGLIAFFLSAIADNMTTALVMGAVIMAVGAKNSKFVGIAMVNVVVAANSGGAFSPFGDITTLMVWQSGHIGFFGFFKLFLPSVANWIVPAIILGSFVPKGTPEQSGETDVSIKRGGITMCVLFLITIAMAISFEQILGLQPFLGMMTGLSFLMIYSWFLRRTGKKPDDREFDIFVMVSKAEWDTLLFFFGVIFAVGGLAYIGYLYAASVIMYGTLGPTATNILAGIVSAVIDNIPVMFAILNMAPKMGDFHWLLITLTTAVGGSLLAVGSAAGVALMGQSKGNYTFFGHLKCSGILRQHRCSLPCQRLAAKSFRTAV
jgi:Na+/H+ antiporter NhaD/arsenite permease-like protein